MNDFQFSYGIPTTSEYNKLLASNFYKSLEKKSDEFLEKNDSFLSYYKAKWVKDPLHQWSRQYEYPFVFKEILDRKKNDQPVILDAGSGLTFFPFLLKTQFPLSQIHCCDYDENLGEYYQQISTHNNLDIHFKQADIRKLPYNENTFDIIYCISVLEHTDNFEAVLSEFNRVLKTGGSVIITYDISYNDGADIPVAKANQLMNNIASIFDFTFQPVNLKQPDLLTTEAFRNTPMLPWKIGVKEMIYNLLKFKNPFTIPHLTFYCLTCTKKAA